MIHMEQVDGEDGDLIVTAEFNGDWRYLIFLLSLYYAVCLRGDHCSFLETLCIGCHIAFSNTSTG